jgi:hypothetical protein
MADWVFREFHLDAVRVNRIAIAAIDSIIGCERASFDERELSSTDTSSKV